MTLSTSPGIDLRSETEKGWAGQVFRGIHKPGLRVMQNAGEGGWHQVSDWFSSHQETCPAHFTVLPSMARAAFCRRRPFFPGLYEQDTSAARKMCVILGGTLLISVEVKCAETACFWGATCCCQSPQTQLGSDTASLSHRQATFTGRGDIWPPSFHC